MDHLCRKDQDPDPEGSLVREQLQALRKDINSQIAELTGEMLKQFRNGAAALPKLNNEDLCIIPL